MTEELLEGEVESRFPATGFVGTTPVACRNCGAQAETRVDRQASLGHEVLATCPVCGDDMVWDPSGVRFSFRMGMRGFSSTKQGMRRARSFTEEGEKLKKTQWDNVEPMKVPEGVTVRNPTPGGPRDPNGPFARRDPHRVIVSGIGGTSND